MAIRLVDQYPNRVGTPDADYPHGVPRNKSAPTATDGTPYEQAWFRDQEGYFQGLVESAGITPSGTPDTVRQSDYIDALVQVASGVTEIDVSGDQDVTVDFKRARIFALKLTGALAGDIDLIVPDTERIYWVIDETTGAFSVTVRTAGGSGVEIVDSPAAVRSDGTDVVDFVGPSTEVISGLIKIATQPQTDAGTDDSTAVSPKKLRWGVSYDISGDGYIALPSWLGGLIIQWGRGELSNTNVGYTDFPIAFPTSLVHAVVGDASNNNGSEVVCWRFDASTNTQLAAYSSAGNALGQFSYLAIGY